MVLIYTTLAMTVFIGMASLAVDYGRVQVAKGKLQTVTDGAARYAACGLRSTMLNTSGASANAAAVFAANNVDGQPVIFNTATDIQLGIWTASTRTFAQTSDASAANAVRLSTKVTLGDATYHRELVAQSLDL